ncbi:MAG: hypothetical protein CSA11_11860 [Chloroflexi bacterium]|nr:MAG: hypothetical protein CSA11_11860 [Chloroflexota bacterium]
MRALLTVDKGNIQGVRALSKKHSQSLSSRELGFWGLLLAILILGIMGWFGKDATGYPYRGYGAIGWVMAVLIAFVLGMLYYALFVLPVAGSNGWAEGLRLLTRNFINPPPKADTPQKGRRKKAPQTMMMPAHLADLPNSFDHLSSGMLRSHQVLALTRANAFSRPAGPGFVVLYNKENISQVIDLRKHSRAQVVKANTRDGIPIELPIFVSFRVLQDDTKEIISRETIYHYDSAAIFHINYAGSVDEKQSSCWSDLVAPIAANRFVIEVARLTLEQLYQMDSNGNGPKTEIHQRVKSFLETNDQLQGIEIISVGSGIIKLPEEVQKQRIKQWQAQWQSTIMLQKAKVDAEAELRLKHARARAQIEIIQNITQSIMASTRSDVNVTEIVALRTIEALEEAVSDSAVQALVPQPVLDTMVDNSRQMLSWFDEREA